MADELIHCPSCNHRLRVPVELLGQPVECPQCGARFTAPIRADAPAVLPTAASPGSFAPAYADDPEALAHRAGGSVRAPAILLLVFALLAIGLNIFSIVAAENQVRQMQELAQDPDLPPEFARFFRDIAAKTSPEALRRSHAIVFAVNLITVLGAIQMLRLRTYWVAVLGSIVALNPLNCPCCMLETPFALWALIVLLGGNVRAAFR